MPQKMTEEKEEAFWHGLDLEMGEGAGARPSGPKRTAGGSGPVGSMRSGATVSLGRPTLVTSWAGADGGG